HDFHQQGILGRFTGGGHRGHHSISSCNPGNRRWKFFKDFSCQGNCLLPLMTTWLALCLRAWRTNFDRVLIPELLRNCSVRRSRVNVADLASAASINTCKIGAYSSVPRSRNAPWQSTVAVLGSYVT